MQHIEDNLSKDSFSGEITRVSSRNRCDGIEIIAYFSGGKRIAREVIDEDGRSLVMAGNVPDGPVIEYYWTGLRKGIYTYANNRPHGLCKIFYPGGQILWVEQYFNGGLLDGPSRTFYRNNTIWEECFYKKGKLHGDYRSYHRNGNPDTIAHYKEGKLDGEYKSFFENGVQREHSIFKEGKRDGICTTYHETGEPQGIDIYRDGRIIHRRRFYEPAMPLDDRYEPILEVEEEKIKEAEAHTSKGMEYSSIGCYKLAVQEFKKAISIIPGSIETYHMLASAYRHLGRYADYMETLNRILEINPDHSEARLNIAIAHIVTGNRKEALVEHRILQSLDKECAKGLKSILSM